MPRNETTRGIMTFISEHGGYKRMITERELSKVTSIARSFATEMRDERRKRTCQVQLVDDLSVLEQ